MKQRCKFAFVFPRFFNKNFIWNTGGNRRAEGGRDSSQSPRSIKQLRVQICGARLGRPKQRVEKKAVNDGSVCLSFIRRSLSLSLSESVASTRKEEGEGNGEGRRFPQTAPTSVHEGEGRRDWWMAKGDPTDAVPEEAKAAWGFRPQPHACLDRRSTMGEMLVPLTSDRSLALPLIVRSRRGSS